MAPAPAEFPAISTLFSSMGGIIPMVCISFLSRNDPKAPAMMILQAFLIPALFKRNSIPVINAALPSWTERISFWLMKISWPSSVQSPGTIIYCIAPNTD